MLILNVQYQNVIYLADCIFESLLKFCAQGKILPHFVLVAALPQSKLIISRLHFCNSFLTGLSTSIYSCQPSLIHSSHHCPTDLLKIQIDYITSLFQTIQLSQSTWNKIQIPCKTLYRLDFTFFPNSIFYHSAFEGPDFTSKLSIPGINVIQLYCAIFSSNSIRFASIILKIFLKQVTCVFKSLICGGDTITKVSGNNYPSLQKGG